METGWSELHVVDEGDHDLGGRLDNLVAVDDGHDGRPVTAGRRGRRKPRTAGRGSR